MEVSELTCGISYLFHFHNISYLFRIAEVYWKEAIRLFDKVTHGWRPNAPNLVILISSAR